MVQYLSAFFIFVTILTIFVLSINPSPRKSVSIADSKSKISTENKEVIVDKSTKFSNKDTLQDAGAGFKNVDNFNNVDADFYNQDNFSNVDANLETYENTSEEGIFSLYDEDYSSPVEAETYNYSQSAEPEPVEQPQRQTPSYPQQQPIQQPQTSQNTSPSDLLSGFSDPKEEMISWNIWRSNLGNRIGDDYNIWAPGEGTYMFYFSVDNQRRISKPVIMMIGLSATDEARMAAYRYLYNLQGSDILQFPAGTNRQKVNVIYTIYIDSDTTDKRLHSSDFSDYEKIR